MVDWKQKLKNQWVKIKISCVQPDKPDNFLRLVSFPFQYSSECNDPLNSIQQKLAMCSVTFMKNMERKNYKNCQIF